MDQNVKMSDLLQMRYWVATTSIDPSNCLNMLPASSWTPVTLKFKHILKSTLGVNFDLYLTSMG